MFDHVNWIAVLGAAIAAFAFGALWYGPLLGGPWRKAVGVPDAAMAGAPIAPLLAANFGMALVSATALAVLVTPFAKDVATAAFVAALVWVASGLAVKLNDLLFQRRSGTLFYIDSIGHLIGLEIMAIIVSLFRA
jgi:hypothetical protein